MMNALGVAKNSLRIFFAKKSSDPHTKKLKSTKKNFLSIPMKRYPIAMKNQPLWSPGSVMP